jgi:hypothetical protein
MISVAASVSFLPHNIECIAFLLTNYVVTQVRECVHICMYVCIALYTRTLHASHLRIMHVFAYANTHVDMYDVEIRTFMKDKLAAISYRTSKVILISM